MDWVYSAAARARSGQEFHTQGARRCSKCKIQLLIEKPGTVYAQLSAEQAVWDQNGRDDVSSQDWSGHQLNASARYGDTLCQQRGRPEYPEWIGVRSGPEENRYCLRPMEYGCRNPALEWDVYCSLHTQTIYDNLGCGNHKDNFFLQF